MSLRERNAQTQEALSKRKSIVTHQVCRQFDNLHAKTINNLKMESAVRA
jgi:hypothetical protein